MFVQFWSGQFRRCGLFYVGEQQPPTQWSFLTEQVHRIVSNTLGAHVGALSSKVESQTSFATAGQQHSLLMHVGENGNNYPMHMLLESNAADGKS